jgi:mono/diheme cytochrome c family protein
LVNRALRRILLWLGAAFVIVASAALAATELRWKRTFSRGYPEIAASADPQVVAQGRYLVFGPAACAYCHVPREQWRMLDGGAAPPLYGTHVFRLPPGVFYSSNLTPDPETGIGRRTDRELARILRNGVRADGRAAFPLMEYQRLSDEDLTAVISYLRSQPPVRSQVSDHELSLVGKALMAFVIEPVAPATPPPATSPPSVASVERGEYLANSVSVCVSCHTNRDSQGRLVGPLFGGGQRMDVAADETKVYVTPNLTPHPATSPIGRWSEDQFIARMRKGELVHGTPMPWGAYARMRDEDLRSVYRYLKTLPPFEHSTGAVIQEK